MKIISPVKGYEGLYSVTSCGKVWSEKRNIFLKQAGKRYLSVTLAKNGKIKGFLVHRLVAIAYIENPENKKEVNHKDGDRFNNDVSNLEWSTRSENMKHAHKNGLTNPKGLFVSGDSRRKDRAKLTKDEVIKIRKMYDNGDNAANIHRHYNHISYSNILRCCKRLSFKYIPEIKSPLELSNKRA